MKVDVLWVSWHDDILARGYADQGFLEAIFAGEVWTPPISYTFEHHEVRGDFPDVTGGIVILPARHHTSDEDVDRFLRELDRLDWSLVILSGDEEATFPWQRIPETDTRKVWVMQPRPEHAPYVSGLIPGGWYPWTRPNLPTTPPDRPYPFMFAGQVTHERRRECVRYLEKMKRRYKGIIISTEGYLQGIPRDEYMKLLSQSKFVPCPSGPMHVDTARTLEALEAGCVPVSDTRTPSIDMSDYWSLVFGPDHPFPTVRFWAEFPRYVQDNYGDFQHLSNRVFSHWQMWKRDITSKLHMQLAVLSDYHPAEETITAIISTSPAPIHPSLDHIRTVITSIRERLPHAEILIVCDGVRPEDRELQPAYEEYIRNLLWAANVEWHNVLPIVLEGFHHQANSVRAALQQVRTPYVLFIEHDTPLEGDIPFGSIVNMMNGDEMVDEVRFHFDVALHPEHEPLHFGDVEVRNNIPLLRIRVWWARPFLIRTDTFRGLMDHFSADSRCFLEDKLYGLLHNDWEDHGEAGWDRWRIWTYMPEGDIKRSGHLDSRGHLPKHEQVW